MDIRRHITTIVVAAVTAAVTAGGPPVVAAVYDAVNADRVDGRDAVGAGATRSARAGNLVATNNEGRLPNNIIATAPNAAKVDGLDSTAFVRKGGAAGGALTGTYPSPRLRQPQAWRPVKPYTSSTTPGVTCRSGEFCSFYYQAYNVWFSWHNYGAGWDTVGYYKDPLGVVHLKGLAVDDHIDSPWQVFRLPAGYRPAAHRLFATVGSSQASSWSNAPARINVLSDGVVEISYTCAASTGICNADGRSYISFDGISFRADH